MEFLQKLALENLLNSIRWRFFQNGKLNYQAMAEFMDVCKRYNVQPINNPETGRLYINVSVEA